MRLQNRATSRAKLAFSLATAAMVAIAIRGDVFTKGTNGEPAVLPGVRGVLHGPITKETESDAQGAFAIDGLPPGTYEIEANAGGWVAAACILIRAM